MDSTSHDDQAAGGPFWSWLAANTARIQGGGSGDVPQLGEEISRAFKACYPDLAWEITRPASGPWVFCVSAEGNPSLFDAVERAVRQAPELPGWTVQAFRPRGKVGTSIQIQMADRTLGYDDVWCSVVPGGAGFRVTLWIRGLTRESDAILCNAALVLLDNAVGEYDGALMIQDLSRGPLPADPQRSDRFFPLAELPHFLDAAKGSP